MTTTSLMRMPDTNEDLAALRSALTRYRIMTTEAALRLPAFSDNDFGRVVSAMQLGVEQRLFGQAWLHHGVKYFYRIPQINESSKTSPRRNGPLSEPAKLQAYACLLFCLQSERSRMRLLPNELQKFLPGIDPRGLPGTYYLDTHDRGCLGLLRLDAGRAGRWDRVIQTVRQDISDHILDAAFRPLIQAQRLEITIVTVMPQKAERLIEALRQHPDALRMRVNVTSIPQLLPLLPALAERR